MRRRHRQCDPHIHAPVRCQVGYVSPDHAMLSGIVRGDVAMTGNGDPVGGLKRAAAEVAVLIPDEPDYYGGRRVKEPLPMQAWRRC